jgi:hypothetical protein
MMSLVVTATTFARLSIVAPGAIIDLPSHVCLPWPRNGRCPVLAGCGVSARQGQRRYPST